MSETPPPRRPLATFLRATPAAPALIPTPAVPPTEPPEQAPPAPLAELPPAPAVEPVPAPRSPLVPAPGAGAPDSARGDGAQDAPIVGTAAGPLAQQQAAPATPPTATQAAPAVPAVPASTSTPSTGPTSAAPSASAAPPTPPSASAASLASASPATSAQRPASAGDASTPALPATPATGGAASAAVAVEADVTHLGAHAPGATPPLPLPASSAPAFARRGLSRPRLRASGRQWALLVGLVGVLGLQIVIADRAHLAGDARWRPLVSAACAVLRCSLPAWREPAALTLLNREVRPLPGMPGVLQIQASFRNDARWAQAWPWLQLSLSDVDGRVIGTRVLAPQEYLGQAPAEQDTLAPGQAVQVAFRVREPAASTAAFSFDFR
ncbi:DUF3426 domain-containing protein [Xanthomonas axonopodis pv. poinsettiicola]|uniref:DUF3426 domain-containing protein n=1 Tax=Xanthomonas TaxID=338 RepID=UPI001E376069|nr:DUF3426 domain-containing protein [Xanthomonas codiaei]MCC8539542.1 DUF3426 domain-containing protein [Xanthomonas codiaei]